MQPNERGSTPDRDTAAASREFSADTMSELLRALRARAVEHPESPALIASWPGVPEDRMAAACAELRRQGHSVREVSIPQPGGATRRGWAVAEPADGLEVLVREVAVPTAVPVARAVITRFAEAESAPEDVRSALALAVTEACTNVVLHAYEDAKAPGYLEVCAGRVDGRLLVEVRDEGRGMVPRVDSPGLGLGLPLIAQLADVVEIRARRQRAGLNLRMHFILPGLSPRPAA